MDWNKIADFRSRKTTSDIRNLLLGSEQQDDMNSSKQNAKMLIDRPDATGLYPIHWAAMHNRPDLIDLFMELGSQTLRKRCSNNLFYNCSSLHFAAMNGSIEAAVTLLQANLRKNPEQIATTSVQPSDTSRSPNEIKQPSQTVDNNPTTMVLSSPKTSNEPHNSNKQPSANSATLDWLNELDSEGQTPLMRTAPPRSKRLNIIRELLGKNLWSLSGRPAEMALYLIANGSDWRFFAQNSDNSMNLLHLSILNDYEDITRLLLNIDDSLIHYPMKFKQIEIDNSYNVDKNDNGSRHINKDLELARPHRSPSLSSDSSSVVLFENNKPNNSPSSQSDNSSETNETKLLINDTDDESEVRREKTNQIIAEGLSPMQLAVIYGRIRTINLFKSYGETSFSAKTTSEITDTTLLKSLLLNPFEMRRFIKSTILRSLYVFDLSYIILVWSPSYLFRDDDFWVNLGAFFVISSCILTMLLSIRVITKEPGFIGHNDAEYYSRLGSLVRKSSNMIKKAECSTQPKSSIGQTIVSMVEDEQSHKSSSSSALAIDLNDIKLIRTLCHKCRCIRLPRSRHCNSCQRCVLDFDHHCLYLNTCIGRDNRFEFLLMLISLSLTGLYALIYQNSISWRLKWTSLHYFNQIIASINLISGGLGTFCVLRRAAMGVTLYESIRSKRLRKIFGHRGPPSEISKLHHGFNTKSDAFWRFESDPFVDGDLPLSKVRRNLRDFCNHMTKPSDILARLVS